MKTPADLGFRMPAEFEPHARCWMAWPCRSEAWDNGMQAGYDAYAAVARAIARFEPVTMVARPQDADTARRHLGDGIEVIAWPINDSWTRDTGPLFLKGPNGELAGVDWGFNAWGLIYQGFEDDARLAGRILAHTGTRRFVGPQILEGGSVHVDGQGTLLTTEECLFDPERNPHLTREDHEAHLKAFLGVETVIWLGKGLENDETKGHVDNVACFAAPGKVLMVTSTDPADPDTATLSDNRDRLRDARDAQGRRIEVIDLPQVPRRQDVRGHRMALSYVNFYIANGGIVMPGFDVPEDKDAAAVLRAAFPDREVVVVPAFEVAVGGGNIHCITQQQPKA
ncbi:agmatine deiminase family protein [Caenispirillum bisanense]|uniref:agmatine deiminase family protein n=1 Tax=Caenispirillum bisanense TaxID=414052 RepID=UPI0031CEA995